MPIIIAFLSSMLMGATQIIGGYVLAPGNLKEGNAKGNNVELQNSSVAGFVSGL